MFESISWWDCLLQKWWQSRKILCSFCCKIKYQLRHLRATFTFGMQLCDYFRNSNVQRILEEWAEKLVQMFQGEFHSEFWILQPEPPHFQMLKTKFQLLVTTIPSIVTFYRLFSYRMIRLFCNAIYGCVCVRVCVCKMHRFASKWID